jgi:hypothetical protein
VELPNELLQDKLKRVGLIQPAQSFIIQPSGNYTAVPDRPIKIGDHYPAQVALLDLEWEKGVIKWRIGGENSNVGSSVDLTVNLEFFGAGRSFTQKIDLSISGNGAMSAAPWGGPPRNYKFEQGLWWYDGKPIEYIKVDLSGK